jgi:IS30 family transposase
MTRTFHIHLVVGQHITRPMRTCIEIADNRNLRLPQKDRLSLRRLTRELGLPRSTLHDEIRRGIESIDAKHLNQGRPMTMNTTLAKLLHI